MRCELARLIAFVFASHPFLPFLFPFFHLPLPFPKAGLSSLTRHAVFPLVSFSSIPCFPSAGLSPSLIPTLCRGDATESLQFELAHADPAALARAQHAAKTLLVSLLGGEHGAAEDACGGTEDSCLDISGG